MQRQLQSAGHVQYITRSLADAGVRSVTRGERYHAGVEYWWSNDSHFFAEESETVYISRDDDSDGHDEYEDCDDQDAQHWNDCEYNPDPGSPILINLDGTGVRLTSPAAGVLFELKPGEGKQRRSWTEAESKDAWLALDRNGNGLIDDGTELFGNYTSQPFSAEPNGFLALAVFDAAANGGNANGFIDPGDAVFVRLRLWIDRNHDGVSQPSELISLRDGAVGALGLHYKVSARRDRWGNQFKYRAPVTALPSEFLSPQWAIDVYLVAAPRR